ncbi:MAG TPA: hypothetical protein PK718_08425 [Candidatus Methanofastidiosa archaeon]|nr:hypothetical protein [Candidatus Methanofastidiosa archaeon]HPR42550.1 hypothetical protein [Candidatus Methanofastidiosa archaeon]
MPKRDQSKEIIDYHNEGMHPNEIAARLLMDVQMVNDVIEEYENTSKRDHEIEADRSFVEEELRKGILSLSSKMEELFGQRQFEQYNKASENWLESIKLYLELIQKRE